MLTLTLAISCLTTSNLPWFMDLTFQVPMQYCPLQHQTLLLSPVTSTAGYFFCFGSIPSFFLELFLHWSPVAYWVPTNLGFPLSVFYHFAFSYCSCGSQGNNREEVLKKTSKKHVCVCPPGHQGPNMLLEISGEITPERMKGWSQSKTNTHLWM